ncbi:hypothetical protein [Pelagibacterium lentulum]|uniref:Outer membrane protein beta-barrel domain-containing protein n=1 Tax=Pelagibacterium lentulum TaxID=2029865 RepID=A0A916RC51_9HYPH|nr:hypothetical protein [Pelagibacterium lentulum]GGA49076.1 hypothetical protein GCM10011499_18650 [Pelagibacterium lentulum]
MSRLLVGLAAGGVLVAGMGAANAADWGVSKDPVFKPAYPVHWEEESPLGFEVGMRYFYGIGSQSFQLGGSTFSADDQSHSLEAHLRIDDRSTSTYLKGHFGFGAITDGTYKENGTEIDSFQTGRLAYALADFGYTPLDTGAARAGFFAGYMYANESPQDSGLDIHGLRLGIAGRAELSDMLDISAEIAAIPYAWVSGNIDVLPVPPGQSLTGIDGALYGGAAEVMVGFHPTDEFTIRAGARGTYLNGYVSSDEPGEQYVETFRWGPVVELTYRF